MLGRLTDAEHGFDDAISKDCHFAVAYFQRASVKFQMNRLTEAVDDFDQCHKTMQDKKFIDYGQLGLRFKLHACEPLYNAGVASIHAQDFIKGMDYLLKAQKGKCEARHNVIDQLLQKLNTTFNNRTDGNFRSVKLIHLPPDGVFRPPKSKVANMNEMQFLKEAKVVAAASADDTFTGFVGRKNLEDSKQTALSAPTSPLSPRRGLNKSPTLQAGVLGKMRRALSPGPSADRGITLETAEKTSTIVPRAAKTLPPNKALPPPPLKALPVPPSAARKVLESGQPSHSLPKIPGKQPQNHSKNTSKIVIHPPEKPDVRPKQFINKPNNDMTEELQNALTKMNLNDASQPGRLKVTSKKPQIHGRANEPPPLPPKAEPKRDTRKRRNHNTTGGGGKKPPPPEPPRLAEASALDWQSTFTERNDPNLVSVDLNCYSTVTITVDRGTSLENLLAVAASISEFNLVAGTFNLWCLGPHNEQICIENEEMMDMLWTEKEDDQYLALWCYGKR